MLLWINGHTTQKIGIKALREKNLKRITYTGGTVHKHIRDCVRVYIVYICILNFFFFPKRVIYFSVLKIAKNNYLKGIFHI